MSYQAKKEYIRIQRKRYRKAKLRAQKSMILDELVEVCGYNRDYAIRIMNDDSKPRVARKRGAQRVYGEELIPFIRDLWFEMEQVHAARMVAMLPNWLIFYSKTKKGEVCTKEIKKKLLQMSPSTLGRFLKEIRKVRGLSSTRPNHQLKSKIPIEVMSYKVSIPGVMQADTVVHANNSLLGNYAHSLTMVDLLSGWTENRAIWTKVAEQVRDQIADIEKNLPFKLIWFGSDCGSEFLNYKVLMYLTQRKKPIKVTRSRPYEKNDNMFVEQKNWTHVRQLFGYDRIDDRDLIPLMNEIYKIWNTLHNYFFASFKLVEKHRSGGKVIKKYDKPKTPCDRLLESSLCDFKKQKLKSQRKKLNPFELKAELEKKLNIFFERLKKSSSGKKAA